MQNSQTRCTTGSARRVRHWLDPTPGAESGLEIITIAPLFSNIIKTGQDLLLAIRQGLRPLQQGFWLDPGKTAFLYQAGAHLFQLSMHSRLDHAIHV